MTSEASTPSGMLLGYARESPGLATPNIDHQVDFLTDAGVDAQRVYSDRAADGARPGLTALLDYARRDDTVVVIGLDRLGRTSTEVMDTARALSEHGLGLRCLREGLDTDDPAGAMIVGVLAALSSASEESSRRVAATQSGRRGGTPIGRPRALDPQQVALAERMRADGEAVPAIAEALGVSRATLYRTLAERRSTR